MFYGIKYQQTCFFIISVGRVFIAFNSIFLRIINVNVQRITVVSDVHFIVILLYKK